MSYPGAQQIEYARVRKDSLHLGGRAVRGACFSRTYLLHYRHSNNFAVTVTDFDVR